MAWNIVRHAFVIVFGNLQNALKASIVPFIILIAGGLLLSKVTGLSLNMAEMSTENFENVGGIFLFVIVAFIGTMFIFSWIAVTWHRFILLEEYPNTVPAYAGLPIAKYVGRTLMISLQMLPVMLIAMPLIGTMLMNPTSAMIFSAILSVPITFVWLRVSVSLPSVAVGQPIGSVEAWGETKPIWETIFGVSLILIGLNYGATFISSAFFSGIPVISGIISVVTQWVSMMIGISILTTLYGHVVEGRPLVD